MTETENLAALAAASRDLTTVALRRLVTRRAMTDPDRRADVQRLLDDADPTTVNHPQLRIIERHRMSIRRGLSFRAIMIQRSEAWHAGVRDRAWLLDDKAAAYRFADQLGVRRPTGDLMPRSLADIDPHPGTAVKPVRSTGGRGVYLVYDSRRIVEVRTGEELRSWDEAVERARTLMANPRRPIRDRWITEELVLDGRAMARDLKFYAFYGEVLFVQEIERLPQFRAAFWTPSGRRVETGKPTTLDKARGVRREHIAAIERISSEIPTPFMRIDMLRAGRALVLGELTPRPGQFEEFNRATDRDLAEAWMRAERRLLDDALSGKRFTAFEAAAT